MKVEDGIEVTGGVGIGAGEIGSGSTVVGFVNIGGLTVSGLFLQERTTNGTKSNISQITVADVMFFISPPFIWYIVAKAFNLRKTTSENVHMRLASITMIGQFPHGIDIHTRNLLWSLTSEDHIFIVTLPKIIQEFNLQNTSRITYIPFGNALNYDAWINFWQAFPSLIQEYSIYPEWFLFMEQDIWFHERPTPPNHPQTIRSFLPAGDYRNILLDGQKIHDRVWEGAQIVHRNIVQRACEFGVNFSFAKKTFLDRDDKYEKELGGKISMSMYNNPDTMDEFNLYCAIVEKTTIEHAVKAIHLRGPESIHRKFPEIYYGATVEELTAVQEKVRYLDLLTVASCYYVVGLWDKISHLNLTTSSDIKKEYAKLAKHAHKWLTTEEMSRVENILKQFCE